MHPEQADGCYTLTTSLPCQILFTKPVITQVLYETSAWGSPTDITSAMFNGPQFVTDALARRAGLPPTPFDQLVRLQKAIDAGDNCCGNLCA
jgi:hypothetical protein